MLGYKKKMRRKKIERKKMKRRENEEKNIFSLLLFGWKEHRRENEKKENKEYIKWHIYPYCIIKYKYYFLFNF